MVFQQGVENLPLRQIRRDFSPRNMTSREAFPFLMENIYVQFDGMVYQQIVGDSYGH